MTPYLVEYSFIELIVFTGFIFKMKPNSVEYSWKKAATFCGYRYVAQKKPPVLAGGFVFRVVVMNDLGCEPHRVS